MKKSYTQKLENTKQLNGRRQLSPSYATILAIQQFASTYMCNTHTTRDIDLLAVN